MIGAGLAGAAGGAGGYLASRALFRACFVKGTPVLTPDGWKPIEELQPGDEVLSRSEHDVTAEVRARRVLRNFVRVSPVLNLHVRGRIIGTTGEHPFWVEDKGWTAARELRIGDVLVSHDGQRVEVEGVADSGRIETVYNAEVEEDHTYFVGNEEWGFSVWAHNADCQIVRNEDGTYDLRDVNTNTVYNKTPFATEAEVRQYAQDHNHTIIGFAPGSGRALPEKDGGDGTVVRSRITDSTKLTREARDAGKSVQQDLDHLQEELASGNRNPGLGNKSLSHKLTGAQ
jgi:hypothetical protein